MLRFSLFGSSRSAPDELPDDEPIRLIALFGSVRLDLRQLELKRTASVEILALFGGVEVIVPPDMPVAAGTQVGLFGGVDLPITIDDPLQPRLEVDAVACFGGVNVKVKALPIGYAATVAH